MGVESGPLLERLEKWAEKLQNVTVSPLTRDYPDYQKPELSKRAIEAFESFAPSEATQDALQKVSSSPSSGFIFFLAAFVVLVARVTGDEDIAIATSSSEDGRPFVIRVPVDASEPFKQVYGKVKSVRWFRRSPFFFFFFFFFN